MAANSTALQVEATTVGGTAEKRGRRQRRRIGIAGLLAAILVAVFIGGAAMHERGTPYPALPAIDGSVALTVTKSLGPAEYDAIQVLMENVAGRTSPAVLTSEQQQFLEENTILPGAWTSTYMESEMPLPGQNH